MSELIIWKKFNVTPQNCITVTEHKKIIIIIIIIKWKC